MPISFSGRIPHLPGVALTGLALLATTLSGCGSSPAKAGASVGEIPRSPASLTQDAWYAEGTLHVGDRRQKLGRVHSFAVAAHTVVYTSAGPGIDGEEHGKVCFSNLTRTTCTDDVADRLVVSPDGEHVGYLELSRGRSDKYGTHQATTTVLDLRNGRRLVTSTAGMGDPDKDDLGQLYGDSWTHFAGFTKSGDAVSSGTGPDRVLPLDGGPARKVKRPALGHRDVPGAVVNLRRASDRVEVVPGIAKDSGSEGRLSPDGRFLVADSPQQQGDLRAATAPTGRLARFTGIEGHWWGFGIWSGSHEFLGFTLNFSQSRTNLYRCDVKSRACSLMTTITTKPGVTNAITFPSTLGSDVAGVGQP